MMRTVVKLEAMVMVMVTVMVTVMVMVRIVMTMMMRMNTVMKMRKMTQTTLTPELETGEERQGISVVYLVTGKQVEDFTDLLSSMLPANVGRMCGIPTK